MLSSTDILVTARQLIESRGLNKGEWAGINRNGDVCFCLTAAMMAAALDILEAQPYEKVSITSINSAIGRGWGAVSAGYDLPGITVEEMESALHKLATEMFEPNEWVGTDDALDLLKDYNDDAGTTTEMVAGRLAAAA